MSAQFTTVRQALMTAAQSVARRDAETLLAHSLGCERPWLLAHPDSTVSGDFLNRFVSLVRRRTAREPLQYLTGMQEFYGLPLQVTPATLIPRPETEHLVEQVLLWAAQAADPQAEERTLRIADVGTGSGAIAIALATHLAGVDLVATDTSSAALAVARSNAEAHGCTGRIRFVEGDLLAGQTGLDAVVSNPPYISLTDAAGMQPEVVQHEPHGALFAGADGLAVYRRLLPVASLALRAGGLLALEFGFGQRDALAELLAGWTNVRFVDDYAGIPRVALATRP